MSHVLGRLLLEFQPYWTPEKSSHETQISFVSSCLELFVARSVTAVSSGACSECLYGGDCVWNKHLHSRSGHALDQTLTVCSEIASDVSQAPIIPRSTRGFSISGYVSGQMVTSEYMNGVGRAVLPPVLSSVELQRLEAAGVRRRVICSQLKLLRVHDRANYLGNEAENAGRLEYYIVK